jgi:NCS2 family nucleobase:cation symporter-2
VSGEVIDRATTTTMQVLAHLAAARLVQRRAQATVSYDQLDLLIELTYEGTLLSLPNVGVKRGIWLEEESFSYGLADFLTGVYPDRMESSASGSRVSLRLYFTA